MRAFSQFAPDKRARSRRAARRDSLRSYEHTLALGLADDAAADDVGETTLHRLICSSHADERTRPDTRCIPARAV